jgi:hypothetical protein
MDPDATLGWDVEMEIPCQPRYARVVRTVAAACGVLEGFSVDVLGDVRLLVDEVFMAMGAAGVTVVRFRLTPSGGRLGVEIEAAGRVVSVVRPDLRFVESLADVVAERVSFGLDGELPRFAATIAAGRSD